VSASARTCAASRASNQNGAPNDPANAVSSQPSSFTGTSYQRNADRAVGVQHALAAIGTVQPAPYQTGRRSARSRLTSSWTHEAVGPNPSVCWQSVPLSDSATMASRTGASTYSPRATCRVSTLTAIAMTSPAIASTTLAQRLYQPEMGAICSSYHSSTDAVNRATSPSACSISASRLRRAGTPGSSRVTAVRSRTIRDASSVRSTVAGTSVSTSARPNCRGEMYCGLRTGPLPQRHHTRRVCNERMSGCPNSASVKLSGAGPGASPAGAGPPDGASAVAGSAPGSAAGKATASPSTTCSHTRDSAAIALPASLTSRCSRC